MINMKGGKKSSPVKRKASKSVAEVQSLEMELEKKKKQLLAAKARYRRLAGEFIDLWVKTRRAQRNASK